MKKILVVVTDGDLALLVKEAVTMEFNNPEIVLLNDFQRSVRAIDEHKNSASAPFDLVITGLSINSPNDGFQIARHAKESFEDTKVIMISDPASQAHVEHLSFVGSDCVDGHLYLPFRLFELFELIEDVTTQETDPALN